MGKNHFLTLTRHRVVSRIGCRMLIVVNRF